MDSNHEIFQKPHKVNLTYEQADTPKDYRNYPEGADLPDKIKTWQVQNKALFRSDPGLVSNPYGFTDSPDTEVISSGLNSKGPTSVALGRQGSFFLWGFSGSPAKMTPEARKAFLNAVCYIRKFDGAPVLVRQEKPPREYALFRFKYLKSSQEEAWSAFPQRLIERFGKDAARLEAYYKDNFEALYPMDNGNFDVDEDVLTLGGSNRCVAMLEQAVARLEKGQDAALALRVLHRYTSESFSDAAAWRRWLETNRDRLFFSDVGGYRFFAGPNGRTVAGK